MWGASVDEMNAQSIDQCTKVWKRVQLCLEASPVVARFPILYQRFCLGEGNPVRPVFHRPFVGESGSAQARSKIVNGFLRNRDMKQTDLFRSFGRQRRCPLRHVDLWASSNCVSHRRTEPVAPACSISN